MKETTSAHDESPAGNPEVLDPNASPVVPPGASLADDLRGAMHGWLSTRRPRDAAERDGLIAAWKAGAEAAVTEMRLRLDRLPSSEVPPVV